MRGLVCHMHGLQGGESLDASVLQVLHVEVGLLTNTCCGLSHALAAVGLQLQCPGVGLQLVSMDRDQRVTAQLQGISCVCPDVLAASASATCSADHVLVHNQKQLLSDQPQTFPVLVMPASGGDCAAYASSFNFRQQRAAHESSRTTPAPHLQQAGAQGRRSPQQQPTASGSLPGGSATEPVDAGVAQQQDPAAGMRPSSSSSGNGCMDPDMIRIYKRSLVCLYLMNVKVRKSCMAAVSSCASGLYACSQTAV